MKKIRGISSLMAMATAMVSPMVSMGKAISALLQTHDFSHRGHGGGYRANGSRMKTYSKMRAQKNRGKENHPHTREITRRLHQMNRTAVV